MWGALVLCFSISPPAGLGLRTLAAWLCNMWMRFSSVRLSLVHFRAQPPAWLCCSAYVSGQCMAPMEWLFDHGYVALWLCACGSVPAWLCGPMALWHCGTMALWHYVCASHTWLRALWHYGTTPFWLFGALALLLFGTIPGKATHSAVPLGFRPKACVAP